MVALQLVEGITNLAVSVIIFTVGLFVYLKGKRQKINWMFFVFCIPVSVWLFFYGLAFLSKEAKTTEFLFKSGYISIVFIPILTFHFALVFLEREKKFLKLVLYLGYFSAFIFSVLINFTPYIIGGLFKYHWGYYPKASLPAHFIFILYFNFYYIIAILLLFFGFWKRTDISPIEKSKRRYVFLAWMIGSFSAIDFIPNYGHAYGINILPLGSIFMIPTYSLIGYAVAKYRLMDIRIFISRALAFLVSYTFLLGVPFFFAYRMHPVLKPLLGENWWLAPVALLTFFATLAPLAYDQIKRGMEERLLADQKRYQKLLLQAASGMAREHNLKRLSKLVVYIVKRIVKIEFAIIFLDDKEQKKYQLKAVRDASAVYDSVEFSYDDPFVTYLKTKKEPLLYEELPLYIRSSLKFPKRISLIVPSTVEDNLLGFVVLGEKTNHEHYTDDDINVFKILTHQTTMAIENCLFFEEFRNAQEKIFTAEKLASIGGMADGVAHQIKNRLNHFSIASGELKCEIEDFIEKHPQLIEQNPDLVKTFDYAKQIAESLIKNVKHTDGIVKGILCYARVEEKETFFSYFSLKEVIDVALELLKIKHEINDFPLDFDLDDSDLLYGVKAQIMEAVYNMIDNSYEAALDRKNQLEGEERYNFQPKVNLKLIQNVAYSRIEISDNGIGIKDEDKHKIFAPFFTTKSSYKSGTGIGMYVVGRIVKENHKGKIWFETSYMQGTKFIMELPKK